MSEASDENDTAPDPTTSYESARDALAAVVEKLEAGGLSLEESLGLWERGEALATICDRHLTGARERVDAALASVEENADAAG
jgi:exodeoxyribonuclease VII small subunit